MSGVSIVGYCEPVSSRPGDRIELKLSCDNPGPVTVDIVEVICGDAGNPVMGLKENVVEVSGYPQTVEGFHQPLVPGSSATFGPSPLLSVDSFTLGCAVRPSTRPDQPQAVARLGDATIWWSKDGFSLDSGESTGSLDHGRWYSLIWSVQDGQGHLTATAVPTPSPGIDTSSLGGVAEGASPAGGEALTIGDGFDGRVGELWMADHAGASAAEADFRWDASVDMDGTRWHDTGRHQLHGTLHQLPTRAVRGPSWDGSSQTPTTAPSHYDAVHFHTSDLYDAAWETASELTVPDDLPSGLYCFRTRGADGAEDRTPFFVAPAIGAPRADVAFLMPVATYLAYANQRIHLTNDVLAPGDGGVPPNHEWLRDHPEVGYSLYEYHPDGSGVAFSSRRRPVMNMKPAADTWGFTPDTNIVAFLHQQEIPFDIVTDEQLHEEGVSALDGYRVIVTGSHPEYWSTAMLDGLEAWQRTGGRLMYLGGNGFYWRVAFSDDWPGAMEVRRAEDGTRAWIAEAGEYHHAFGGEYGGLWRRLDRAPNKICGIGFAAQGFGRGSAYRRSFDEPERTDWIFEGVEGEVIGDHGVGGGASGQEIDRYDVKLGSPAHAVVLASATDHDAEMLRTKEEFHYVLPDASRGSAVRSDMVFYEVAGGGAVFSAGSIAWFGALASNGYDNDVARITANVLHRFRDPAGW